jgi:hypothetical protein
MTVNLVDRGSLGAGRRPCQQQRYRVFFRWLWAQHSLHPLRSISHCWSSSPFIRSNVAGKNGAIEGSDQTIGAKSDVVVMILSMPEGRFTNL